MQRSLNLYDLLSQSMSSNSLMTQTACGARTTWNSWNAMICMLGSREQRLPTQMYRVSRYSSLFDISATAPQKSVTLYSSTSDSMNVMPS